MLERLGRLLASGRLADVGGSLRLPDVGASLRLAVIKLGRRLSLRNRLLLAFFAAVLPFVGCLLFVYARSGHGSAAAIRRDVLVSLALGGCVCVVVAWRVARAAVRPVRQAVTVLQTASEGNLRPRLAGSKRVDEFGEMARALNKMLDNAADAFFAVGSGVHTLSTASRKLAGTSDRLAVSADSASDESTFVSYAADKVS